MADDLSLLFRLRGDASGAKAAASETRTAIQQLRTESSADLGKLSQSGTASLKSLEASIASVKARIKEVKTEAKGEIPFKAERLESLRERLKGLTAEHKQLTNATERSARAHKDDLASALQVVSPRLAGLVGATGPITLVAAGFVATAAAAAGLAAGLFALAKSTADFQGELLDLNQQTGVSVETLSALDIVARTTGSSIQELAASLGVFQKNMEESLDPTSKQAEAFKRLGVTVTDTEQTFRDTLQVLSRMPEGFRQTALALELFGRGGKSVLAILKETQGDLDGTIEKLRGMGLVTTEQARKADEFNDKLVLLEVALRGLGTEAIPLIIEVLDELQKTIEENKDAINFLKNGIEFITFLFTGPLKGAVKAGDLAWKSHKEEIGLLTEAYQILKGAISGAVAEIPKQPITSAAISGIELLKELQRLGAGRQIAAPAQDFSKIKGLFLPTEAELARAQAEAQQRATRDVQLRQAELEESTQRHRRALERERDLDIRNTDEWEEESTRLLREHLSTQQDVFDQEQSNINRFVQNAEDKLLAERELLKKRIKATNDFLDEVQRIEDEAQRRRQDANRRREQGELALERQLASIQQAGREGELKRLQAAVRREELLESQAIVRELELLEDAHRERLLLIDIELGQQTTSAERKTELDNEKIKSEQEYTDEVKRLTQERIDAINRERKAEFDRQNEAAKGKTRPRRATEKPPGPFDPFEIDIDQFAKDLEASVVPLADILKNAFLDVADAIGSVIAQWVLLGETGPAVMRKILASALASIAAEAAVNAIKMAAVGFAHLASFNFAAAGQAFASSALWASIAGVSALVGRAVAGDAFKSKTGGSTGAGGIGSGQLNPLTLNRNQAEPRRIIVEFRADDSRFGQAITAHVVRDITNAGPIREAYNNDSNI